MDMLMTRMGITYCEAIVCSITCAPRSRLAKKDDVDDDEPTYVDEESNEVISKEEYEALLRGDEKLAVIRTTFGRSGREQNRTGAGGVLAAQHYRRRGPGARQRPEPGKLGLRQQEPRTGSIVRRVNSIFAIELRLDDHGIRKSVPILIDFFTPFSWSISLL
jgi:hypothetical protein